MEIVIESAEEARALYAVFNYSPNIDLFSPEVSKKIADCIGHSYNVRDNDEVISRGITYKEFYRSKVRVAELRGDLNER